jgi:glutamate formiminotransferase
VAHSSAGAAAVGCRAPLVAFNLLLDTPDPRVARRVASLIRESSGGLPGVQALGLLLPGRGRTQVSMNLVDPGPAAIREVVDAVRNAAAGEGTRVTGAELVGLAPAAVLAGLEACDLPGMPTAADAIEARLQRCSG